MPRRFIKRFLPEPHHVRDHRHLRHFGQWLHDPNLWHLNRHSVSGAFAIGLFCAFVPVPGQMILAAALAIAARVNLPLAAALVWITNPLTIAPMFYTAYKVGSWVLGYQPEPFAFELTLDWITNQFKDKWQPLLVGCFIMGSAAALAGFLSMRLSWRIYVAYKWWKRRERPRSKRQTSRVGSTENEEIPPGNP